MSARGFGGGKATARVVGVSLIAIGGAIGGLLTPARAATKTFTATADASVSSTSPTANAGSSSTLEIRNAVKYSYVRFSVSGLPAGEVVTKATLQVYARSPSRCSLGAQVLRAANSTWGEGTITWNNQPGATGSVLATANWSKGGYVGFQVTPAVGGSGAVSFLIRHVPGCSATTDATFRSRETTRPPRLVVETTPTSAAPQCSDGRDNDSDGRIDYPADPGCTGTSDNDETNPPPSGAIKVVAAGDIVCDPTDPKYGGGDPGRCQHRATDDLLAGANAVLLLGDLQYEDGTLVQYTQAFDPTWGQSTVEYPSPGNHEYHVTNAKGYFDYWTAEGRPTGGIGKGYYSFDLGAWHVISLNSGSCAVVACSEGSAQNNFLEQDLAATTERCIVAYWHHPLFTSGSVHAGAGSVKPFWDDLYAAGADIVLNGHDHNYQRYAKQTPAGQAAASGIREFIVGTGGKSHYALATPVANFEFGNATAYGVLKLTLADGSYSWQFVAVGGAVLDSGGPVACN
jgi:hypothetical protein